MKSAEVGNYLGPVKTESSRRDLDVEPMVIAAVSEHLARFAPGEIDIAVSDNDRTFRTERRRLIIPGLRGGPFRPSNMAKMVAAAATTAGIDRPVTFHALRHHYASLALRDGVPIPELCRNLGHSDPTITLKVYTRYMPSPTPRRFITANYDSVDEVLTAEGSNDESAGQEA
jgi:integrase